MWLHISTYMNTFYFEASFIGACPWVLWSLKSASQAVRGPPQTVATPRWASPLCNPWIHVEDGTERGCCSHNVSSYNCQQGIAFHTTLPELLDQQSQMRRCLFQRPKPCLPLLNGNQISRYSSSEVLSSDWPGILVLQFMSYVASGKSHNLSESWLSIYTCGPHMLMRTKWDTIYLVGTVDAQTTPVISILSASRAQFCLSVNLFFICYGVNSDSSIIMVVPLASDWWRMVT